MSQFIQPQPNTDASSEQSGRRRYTQQDAYNELLGLRGVVRVEDQLFEAMRQLHTERQTVQALRRDVAVERSDLSSALDDTRQKDITISDLRGRVASLQSELEQRNAENDLLVDALNGVQEELDEANEEFSLLQGSYDQIQAFLTTARTQLVERETAERVARARIEGQLAAVRRNLASKEQRLVAANNRINTLEEEKALLIPPSAEDITASLFDSLRRLQEAADRVTDANGNRPQRNFPLNRDGIRTLFYSYTPQGVEYAVGHLRQLISQMRQGERRIRRDVLFHLSGALGYYNLFIYLKRNDRSVLDRVCNLSIPQDEIATQVFDLSATSWLERNMPPRSQVPNSACCFTSESGSTTNTTIARAIIAIEKANLLAFRDSLSLAFSVLSPELLSEETELPEQSPVRWVVVEEPTHLNGEHIYRLTLHDDEFLTESYQIEARVLDGTVTVAEGEE